MRRPMERVAAPLRSMGARIRHTRRARRRSRSTAAPQLRAIDYALPVASAQVKSAVLLAALQRRRHAPASPSRRPRAITPSACCGAFGVEVLRGRRAIAHRGRAGAARGTRSRCRRISPPRRSSSWPAASRPSGGLLLRNVGVNPTRTGLLEMLRRWAPTSACIRSGSDAPAPEPSRSPTSRCARAPAAVSRCRRRWCRWRSMSFRCSSSPRPAREGETLVRGAQELRVKESDRLAAMAQGLDRARAWRTSCSPTGCGSAAARGFRRRHHRQPRRSPHRHGLRGREPARARRRSRSSTWPMSPPRFPAFVELARAAGLQIESADGRCGHGAAVPIVTIDGPSGSGKGTISRAVAAQRRLAPARQRRAVPPGGARRRLARDWTRRGRAGHAALAAAMDVRFGAGPDGGERVLLDGRGRHRRDPHRGGRAGRLPGGRLARGAGGAPGAPAGLRQAPRAGGRRPRHGHRGLSRAPTSRFS